MLEDVSVIIPGALTIALGALLVWGGKLLWERVVRRRPDFVVTRVASEWIVERTGRRLAYNVVWNVGVVGATSSSYFHAGHGVPIGDMASGDRQQLALTSDPGHSGLAIWFAWIDKKRWYTRTVDISQGDRFEFVGILPRKDGSVQT